MSKLVNNKQGKGDFVRKQAFWGDPVCLSGAWFRESESL